MAFSTYQAGKLFLIGRKPHGQLSAFERTFQRTMGLWADGQTMWLSSVYQLWRLENILAPGETTLDGYDRLFVPQVGYTTGDIDIHDVAVDGEGVTVFANTLFSCLATFSDRFSFQPLWRPTFVSRIAAEDRCHLNGLAIVDGHPRYVTVCAQTDVVDGWRDQRSGGGCVLDVDTGAVVCHGLSMPHSPRWHDGKLWVLNSGTGHLGFVEPDVGRFTEVAFCPGYARGLAFVGNSAVVGLSRCRQEGTFAGLPLDNHLHQRKAAARCGLVVIDTHTGDTVHWLRIEGGIEELYDVVALHGVVRPMALGFKTEEVRHAVWFENEDGRVATWSATPK